MRFAAAVVLGFVCSAVDAGEPRVLRIGMDTRQPPWAFVRGLDYSREDMQSAPSVSAQQLRKLEGFEVDVMNALARRLGARPQVVPTSWFALEQGLLERVETALRALFPELKRLRLRWEGPSS